MSALAEQIAREHARVTPLGKCLCGAEGIGFETSYGEHIAISTERLAREQIAKDIESSRVQFDNSGCTPGRDAHLAAAYDDGLETGARIAEGGKGVRHIEDPTHIPWDQQDAIRAGAISEVAALLDHTEEPRQETAVNRSQDLLKEFGPVMLGSEVAAIFGVRPVTVARWAEKGLLDYFRTPGGHRRYPTKSVLQLLRAGMNLDADG